MKKELAGLTLTKETFKKEWEGAVRLLWRRTSLRRSSRGIAAAKSVLRSAEATSRKLKKEICVFLFH
jgi:hypothetical protein